MTDASSDGVCADESDALSDTDSHDSAVGDVLRAPRAWAVPSDVDASLWTVAADSGLGTSIKIDHTS